MTVPTNGSFSMFGHTDNTTIAGAIIEGGANSTTIQNITDFNTLITLSDINLFDSNFSEGATTLTQISKTSQYRGYPIPTTTAPINVTLPELQCNQQSSISGSQNYPTTQPYVLETSTGIVTLQYEAFDFPDRFIVIWDNNIVIDTKYRGGSSWNINGSNRENFKNSLIGRIDPLTDQTYPFIHPDNDIDGYPIVFTPGEGSATFNKNSSVSSATMFVYGPVGNTFWRATLSCPIEELCTPFTGSAIIQQTDSTTTDAPPETTNITFFNSVEKDNPDDQVLSNLLMTRPTNVTVINNTTGTNSTGSAIAEPVNHTINVSAIDGNGNIITVGSYIVLSIIGGVNQYNDPFLTTSTSGFLTVNYTFINDPNGYQIDATVTVNPPQT